GNIRDVRQTGLGPSVRLPGEKDVARFLRHDLTARAAAQTCGDVRAARIDVARAGGDQRYVAPLGRRDERKRIAVVELDELTAVVYARNELNRLPAIADERLGACSTLHLRTAREKSGRENRDQTREGCLYLGSEPGSAGGSGGLTRASPT